MSTLEMGDADRSAFLIGLGAEPNITVRDVPILALYTQESQRFAFDDAQISGYAHALRCLWSDVVRYKFVADEPVSIPEEGDFYIAADPVNEDGMALIELRKA